MKFSFRPSSAIICASAVLIAALPATSTAIAGPGQPPAPKPWIAAWAASPQPADPDPSEPLLNLDDQTVRERVRVFLCGEQIRIRLSNEHGSTSLSIGSATVALTIDPTSVRPGSIKPLTFAGHRSVKIPPGAPILSDPVDLHLAADTEISISLYFPGRVATPTLHVLALKHAVVTTHGDFTAINAVETQGISESSILAGC